MSEQSKISALEKKIFDLTKELGALRKQNTPTEIRDYSFMTDSGTTTLRELFGDHNRLLVIHNMGQGCRYCTLWADGFNGFLPHLESALAVVLVSKDPPSLQRQFASSRGWRYRLASHAGGDYIQEQSVVPDADNMPGAVLYELEGGKVLRKNAAAFGPGDIYCSLWSLLGLAGLDESAWTPQFNYWKRPTQLDDGGANILD